MKIRQISECFVKPPSELLPQESKQPYHLGPLDLFMLSSHYIQNGLLFHKPPSKTLHPDFLHLLKNSLSTALLHFYPLSGRLVTITNHHHPQPSITVYVDCVNSPGAKFIHAALDVTISDVLSPVDVPSFIHSFFDHHKAVNYDGHTMSLLSVQVTELLDGIFIGCSFNHAIGDGTSYWHFFNMWSEIYQSNNNSIISRPPVLKRWCPDGYGPIINLPFTNPDQFITRFEAPPLRVRIFHVSAESVARLKAKANAEYSEEAKGRISSFQSLSAVLWRSITRARRIPEEEGTICGMAANNRRKLEPPLCENYFGSVFTLVRAEAKAGELVGKEVGWAAWKLHEAVVNNRNETVRETVEEWLECPRFYDIGNFNKNGVMMGCSARFNTFGNEFGMGKAVAMRSGYASKYDGKIGCYPGRDGGGSVDLEICLSPQIMQNLLSDSEFIDAVSFPP